MSPLSSNNEFDGVSISVGEVICALAAMPFVVAGYIVIKNVTNSFDGNRNPIQ